MKHIPENRKRDGGGPDRWTAVRVAGPLLLAVAAAPAVNCFVSKDQYGVDRAYIWGQPILPKGKAREPADHYFGFTSKRGPAGANYRPEREIWAPFRWEATLGLFDPEAAELGEGSFGMSLLGPDLGTPFYGLTMRRTASGVSVTAEASGEAVFSPVTVEFPGEFAASVAIEHDGTNVLFLAAAGRAAPVEIARTPHEQAGPFQSSLDAGGVPKGAIVGWDDLRLAANGVSFGPPNALRKLEFDTYDASDLLVDAIHATDGVAPDLAGARTHLTDAVAALDQALADAEQADAPKKTRKGIASARKKANSAIAKIDDGKPATSVMSSASAAAIAAIKAAAAVR